MSIGYTLFMESSEMTQEIFLKELEALGYGCKNVINLESGIEIDDFFISFGFIIYLLNASDHSYNIWDSVFLERKFKFQKIIAFDLNNEFEDFDICYKNMLNIVFTVMHKISKFAIFIEDTGPEYAYLVDNDIYLNNETGIWDWRSFKDFVTGRQYKIVNSNPFK